MNKEVTNSIWKLEGALEAIKSCDRYDFDGDDADDLEKLYDELDALYSKSDETIYDLMKMVDKLRAAAAQRRSEEETETESYNLAHRQDLQSYWNSTRI